MNFSGNQGQVGAFKDNKVCFLNVAKVGNSKGPDQSLRSFVVKKYFFRIQSRLFRTFRHKRGGRERGTSQKQA